MATRLLGPDGARQFRLVASLGAVQGFGIAVPCLGALGSSPALLCALTADPGRDSPIGPTEPAFVLRVLLAEVHGLLLCSLCSSLWRVETEQPVSTGCGPCPLVAVKSARRLCAQPISHGSCVQFIFSFPQVVAASRPAAQFLQPVSGMVKPLALRR